MRSGVAGPAGGRGGAGRGGRTACSVRVRPWGAGFLRRAGSTCPETVPDSAQRLCPRLSSPRKEEGTVTVRPGGSGGRTQKTVPAATPTLLRGQPSRHTCTRAQVCTRTLTHETSRVGLLVGSGDGSSGHPAQPPRTAGGRVCLGAGRPPGVSGGAVRAGRAHGSRGMWPLGAGSLRETGHCLPTG